MKSFAPVSCPSLSWDKTEFYINRNFLTPCFIIDLCARGVTWNMRCIDEWSIFKISVQILLLSFKKNFRMSENIDYEKILIEGNKLKEQITPSRFDLMKGVAFGYCLGRVKFWHNLFIFNLKIEFNNAFEPKFDSLILFTLFF